MGTATRSKRGPLGQVSFGGGASNRVVNDRVARVMNFHQSLLVGIWTVSYWPGQPSCTIWCFGIFIYTVYRVKKRFYCHQNSKSADGAFLMFRTISTVSDKRRRTVKDEGAVSYGVDNICTSEMPSTAVTLFLR